MPKQELLVRTLVELADYLVDDFDVVELLSLLSDRCVATLDVAAAGVMLAASGGQLEVIASSSAAMRTLELFQLQSHEGPCVDCFRTGTPIVNLRLSDDDPRWPAFTGRALAQGFQSVHSLPMHIRGRTIGALNMFRVDAGALDEDDVTIAQGFADVATISIVQHQAAADAATLNQQLNQTLNDRVVIEQAKGMVAQATRVDMDQAFQRLRDHALTHNIGLADLARNIASGAVALESFRLDRSASPVTPPVSHPAS